MSNGIFETDVFAEEVTAKLNDPDALIGITIARRGNDLWALGLDTGPGGDKLYEALKAVAADNGLKYHAHRPRGELSSSVPANTAGAFVVFAS